MPLALFDLDHTLLDGDRDDLWYRFLVGRGVVDNARFTAKRVEHPLAVNPDAVLNRTVQARGWPVMCVRRNSLAVAH